MMGSLRKKTYQTMVAPTSAKPERHYWGCLLFCMVVVLTLTGVLYQRTRLAVSRVVAPTATRVTAPAAARVTDKAGWLPCVARSADCGSIAPGPANHVITSRERAALAIVYPTPERFAPGVDGACYWANYYGVSCADVKAKGDK